MIPFYIINTAYCTTAWRDRINVEREWNPNKNVSCDTLSENGAYRCTDILKTFCLYSMLHMQQYTVELDSNVKIGVNLAVAKDPNKI